MVEKFDRQPVHPRSDTLVEGAIEIDSKNKEDGLSNEGLKMKTLLNLVDKELRGVVGDE